MLLLRFADGFGTTARAYTFDWLVDGRNSSPSAWPAAVVYADLEVPPLVRIHGVCFTGDVLGSERCDCAAQRRTPLVLPCDDVLDAVA